MVLYNLAGFWFVEEPGIFGFVSGGHSAGSKENGEVVENLCNNPILIKDLHGQLIIAKDGKLLMANVPNKV